MLSVRTVRAEEEDAGLRRLEYLSLLSKLSSDFETHLRCGERVLAEFVIVLGRDYGSVEELGSKLKEESGAELPDYFLCTLFSTIHAFYPREDSKKDGVTSAAPDVASGKNKFNALSIADGRGRVKELERELEMEARERRRRDRGYGDRQRDRDNNGYERKDGEGRNGGRCGQRPGEPVYKGRVSRVMDLGCSVQLNDFRGKEGLVHVSQIANRRINNAKDVVRRDQEVFVKVISVSGQKLSLSMKDVDQDTGKDLLPLQKNSLDEWGDDGGFRGQPTARTGLSGIKIVEEEEDVGPSRRPLKRMSSPERWEAKQLIASGVLSVKEYPMCDEEGDGSLYQEEGAEEELEIEMNEDEPAFLHGQTRYSVDMSPVKIFKNPEGSLSCAATLQSALIKERREVREQQQRTMLDSIPKDLNRPWKDPMPETGEMHLAQELRGVGQSAYDMPEWKKDAFGKALTFGQRSKLSIQEQGRACLSTN
ncbi:hypothetical protein Tsubulata_024007 [Turnera subulata]|uniref:S1 motif domain-containing protein n=1 Tax=Turnera subulata TaxID=218843 RepID=A0A9Q0FU92_9ROSI|nr:hypothetical protein Tsubulata_024007 [Turnera subulata]